MADQWLINFDLLDVITKSQGSYVFKQVIFKKLFETIKLIALLRRMVAASTGRIKV